MGGDGGAEEMRFVLMLQKYKVQTAGGLAHFSQKYTSEGEYVVRETNEDK